MRYFVILVEVGLLIAYFTLRGELDAVLDPTEYAGLHTTLEFIVFLAGVDALRRTVRLWYARKYNLDRRIKANFDYGVDNVAKVVVLLGIIIYFFQLLGVDPRTLLTSLSIVAAAIAIITKEYINDFLVGLYFSFSRNFEINDYVKMGEHKGKITELQVLKIRLLNDDDDSVLIPNSKVYNSEIINYTRRDMRLMSIDFELGINYLGNIEELETELATALSDFAEFIEDNSFNLRIVEMHKDSARVKLQYKLRRFDRDLQRDIRKKTVRQVYNHLAAKITASKEATKAPTH